MRKLLAVLLSCLLVISMSSSGFAETATGTIPEENAAVSDQNVGTGDQNVVEDDEEENANDETAEENAEEENDSDKDGNEVDDKAEIVEEKTFLKDIEIEIKNGKVEIKGSDFKLEIKRDKVEYKSKNGKLEIDKKKLEIKGDVIEEFKQKLQEYSPFIEKGLTEKTRLWLAEVISQLEGKGDNTDDAVEQDDETVAGHVYNQFDDISKLQAAIEMQKKLILKERKMRRAYFKKLGQMYKAIGNDQIKAFVNGRIPAFDVPPMIKEGRTLVPLRAISEALGATVGYDQETKTVTIVREGNTISLKLENSQALVNGKVVNLDVPASVENGRTLVPARFIAEGFGAQVDYEPEGNIAIIELN